MKTCQTCETTLIEKIGSFTHIMFEKHILVEDVPYVTCETCGNLEYVSTREVDFLIRDAYRNSVHTVKFCE